VDVFWVYPTVYNGKAINAALDNPQMRQGAARRTWMVDWW